MNQATMALSKPIEFEGFATKAGKHKNAITPMHSLLADHHMKRLAQ